ncbi:MAG: signal peptidase I [Fimbriimonadaceae bacterium]
MLPLLAQAEQGPGFAAVVDDLARTPLSQVVLFVAVCTVARIALHPILSKTPAHKRTGGYQAAKVGNEILDALIYAAVFVFLLIRPFGIQAFRIPSESMLDTLLVNDFLVINKAVYRYSEPVVGDIVVFRPPAYACRADQILPDGQPNVDFIKRLVGGPGDLIEIRDGILYRNGEPVDEPYRRGLNDFDWKLVRYEGSRQAWKGRYVPVVMGPSGEPNYWTAIATEFAVGGISAEDGLIPAPISWVRFDEMSQADRLVLDELRRAPAAKIPEGHFLMVGDNRENSFDGRAWGLVRREDIVGRADIIWWPPSRWGSANRVASPR